MLLQNGIILFFFNGWVVLHYTHTHTHTHTHTLYIHTHTYIHAWSHEIIIIFFSSTSLLLPTRLPPPSCTHAQSCSPMDCSPPGSSVHGLFQARILEWITISFSRSHEIKILLLLGRKAKTNLDNVLKSRDITLLTEVHVVKAMVSPVVTNGCESWTIKKAEHQRIDAFKLWYWRRLLRVPWTVRWSK